MTLDVILGFTVHEFRLRDDVDHALAHRILAVLDKQASVPLLTRDGDDRALAVVRARHAGDQDRGEHALSEALDRIGEGVRSRDFRARVALAEPEAGSHFRLAITEFGRNDAPPAGTDRWVAAERPDADSQLLWIGVTAESAEGLFVLVGHGAEAVRAAVARTGWAAPVTSDLGVRIYAGTRPDGLAYASRREGPAPTIIERGADVQGRGSGAPARAGRRRT